MDEKGKITVEDIGKLCAGAYVQVTSNESRGTHIQQI